MKLNAAAEMMPVSWPEFSGLHPFAPLKQTRGYQELFADLEQWLAEMTGFADVSLQPNAGAQGEFAAALVLERVKLVDDLFARLPHVEFGRLDDGCVVLLETETTCHFPEVAEEPRAQAHVSREEVAGAAGR